MDLGFDAFGNIDMFFGEGSILNLVLHFGHESLFSCVAWLTL